MSQFDEVMAELQNLTNLVWKLIHDLGPRIDQREFQRGIHETHESGDLFADMGVPEPQPYSEEQVKDYLLEDDPRTRVVYKTNQGGEAYVDWNSLDPDMQLVVEIARSRAGEWQLYEDPAGTMRIMVDPEVEQEFRRRKLGNATR